MQELHEIKEYVQNLGRASEPAQVRRQTLEAPGGRQHFTSEESLLSEHSEVRTEVDRPKRKDERNGRVSERMYWKQTLDLPDGRRHYASEASNSQERFEEMDVGRGRVSEVVPSAVQPASYARTESRTRAEGHEQDKNPRGSEVTQERAEVRTLPEPERNELPYSVQLAGKARGEPSTGTERNKQRQQEPREETAEGESVLQNLSVGAGGSDVGVKKKNAEAAETSGARDQGMTEERARSQWAVGVGRGERKAATVDGLRAGDGDVTERSAERGEGRWAPQRELQAEKEATAERLWAIDPQPDVRETEFSTRERDGDVKDRGTEKGAKRRPDVMEAEAITEKARVLPEGDTEEQDTEKRAGTEWEKVDGALEREGGVAAPSALARSEATPRKAIREGLSVTGINLKEGQAQPHLQVERGASASLPEAAEPKPADGSGFPLKAAEQRNAAVVSGAGPGPCEIGPAVEVGRSEPELERGWAKQSLVDDPFSGASSRVLEKEEKRSSETAHRTGSSVANAPEKGASIGVGVPRDISESVREAEEENARARFGGAADKKPPNLSDAFEEVLDEDTCHTGAQDPARAERALGFGVTTVVSDDIVEDVLEEESDFVVISSRSEVNEALAPHLGVTEPETEAIDRGRLVHLGETQASVTSSGLESQWERSRLTSSSAFADVISVDAERPGASDGSAFSAPATGSGSASFRGADSLEEKSPAESPEREGVNLRATPRDARSLLVDGRSKLEEVDLKATPRGAGTRLVEGHSKPGDVRSDEILTPARATVVVDGASNRAANEPPLPAKGSYGRDENVLLEDLELPLDNLEYADVQMDGEPSTRSVAAELFEVQYEDPHARLDTGDLDDAEEDQW
jgi:hypothetical protein